jgi:ABC-type enterochelin transport system ATPase subunit
LIADTLVNYSNEKVEKMKTKLQRALDNEYAEDSIYDNINKSIELAHGIDVYDVIDPTGRILHTLAEIIGRLQNADTLEIMDAGYNIDESSQYKA